MAARFWVGGTGTWDGADTTHWAATSGGAGGQSVPGSGDTVTLDGSSGGGTVTVNTTVTVTSITMGAFTGTLDFATNNNNVNLSTFSGTGTGARTLNMGSGTWTLTGTGSVFDLTTMTNMTLSAASAVIVLTATTAAGRGIIFGAAATFGASISIGANTSGGEVQFTAGSSTTLTIPTLNVTAPNRVVFAGAGARVYAITNGFSFTGSSGSYIAVHGSVNVTFPTISSANAMGGTFLAIGGLTFAGGGNLTATNSFDLGGVTISGGGTKSITAPTGGARIIGG